MARFLRSQPVHYLGKPQVVGAAFVAPPIRVALVTGVSANHRDQKRNSEARHPWATEVRSGYVRGFSRAAVLANSDSIQLAAPPSAGFGTLLALVRRRSTENHAALSLTVAGPSASTEFYIAATASNNLRLWDGSTDSQSSITLLESEGWALIAVTKATGSATPRFHKCVLSTGTWTHSDATTGAVGNWSTTPTAAWFGTSGDGFDWFQGQIAAAAYWSGNALSDVALEALTSIAQIARADPSALWVLNQPSVATAVQDVIGSADQTAVTGTVVQSADIPNFNTGTPQGWTVPFVGIRPPMVIGPGPTEDQTTVRAATVRTRPRHTTTVLRPPAVLASLDQRQQTIRTALVRTRPRKTTAQYRPPTTLQVFSGPTSRLTRTRPRHTIWTLRPPTVLQVFSGPTSRLTRIRPRHTTTVLRPAQVVQVPSVLQQQQTIRVRLVAGRRPLAKTYLRTVVYPLLVTYPGPRVVLTKTRPRPTDKILRPPTVIRVPSVEQEQQTHRVHLVQTRPRPTEKTLRPPQAVRVPSVEQEQQTIRTALVQTRPRPTTTVLEPPAVVAVVVAPPVDVTFQVALVRIRPRPTTVQLQPPIFYKATSEIRSALVRTRPQPTTTNLEPPTQLRVFTTGKPSLTRTRPRRTIWKLRPPTVVRVPSVEQQQRTIRTALTRIRPRPTTTELRPPRVLAAFRDNKLRVVLAPARRPKTRNVRPAVVYKPPVVTTLRSWLTETRPRPTVKRLYPPTVLFEFVFVNYPLRVWTIAVAARQRFVDRTKSLLRPPGPVRVPGNACLDDFPAAIACLDDFKANVACLEDTPGTVACLDDAAASVACLDDQSAAVATLEEEN